MEGKLPQQPLEKALKIISRDEEERYAEMLAGQIGVPYVNLVSYPILPDVIRMIPKEIVDAHHITTYLKIKKTLRVATSRPANPDLPKILGFIKDATHLEPELVVCSESSMRYAIKLYENLPSIEKTEEKVTVSKEESAEWEHTIRNLAELKDKITTIPTSKLLDVIFSGAVRTGASDIHIEPSEHGVRIRYRIDGVLQEIAILANEAYRALRSRIKYLAKLKLDVAETPQDGRFAAEAAGEPVDVRVSLIPGPAGEFIVMRLLVHDQSLLSLDQLGIRPEALVMIREAMHKPHGIIFNTGPTGSGKTTTLYSILNELNKPGVKIVTLEDPIEYKIPGINQSQVEPEKGYSFADGLRSVLRQDPDIILVGEVRDQETASIAIQAALTGHLVLTTLHTNSASGALPRLLDMGVPPFLLAGSVNLIIGQRLVRKICSLCHGSGKDPENQTVICPTCSGTRYKGRISIIETLAPTKEINDLIANQAPVSAFEQVARATGMVTMEQDGLAKVAQGLTTKEEVARVTQE